MSTTTLFVAMTGASAERVVGGARIRAWDATGGVCTIAVTTVEQADAVIKAGFAAIGILSSPGDPGPLDVCGARPTDQPWYRCTLPEGHDGDHAAELPDGHVAATWPQDGAS